MNLNPSMFGFGEDLNPIYRIGRWLNPFRCRATVSLRNHPLEVVWTRRAERALRRRTAPLFIEMQLYFSCVVKKRVLFHEQPVHDGVTVDERLAVAFRAVEASSCDPVEFARNFPEKRELLSNGARRMHPSRLELDYRNGHWRGAFSV
ncbi:MAG TPA: hypothetical protein ENJ01_04100 [Gammaproteobacteria bacterium]|nr:hypothetical protein [Gammaproteobacteria bacterium]